MRRARLRPRLRSPAERRAHPLAGDPLRERRPDRRAQGFRRASRSTRAQPPKRPTARRASCSRRRATICASRCTRSVSTSPRCRRAHATPNGGRWSHLQSAVERAGNAVRAIDRPVAPGRRRARRPSARRCRWRRCSLGFRRIRRRRRQPGPELRVVADPARRVDRCVAARADRRQSRRQRDSLHGARWRAHRRAPVRHRVAIDVVDTGIGIAPADRDRVFEEFFQVRSDDGSTPAHRGMGLGLAIVRRFAALLGHEISARFAAGYRLAVSSAAAARRRRVTRVRGIRRARPHRRAPRSTLARSPAARRGHRRRLGDGRRDAHAVPDVGRDRRRRRDGPTRCSRRRRSSRYPDLIVADLRLADGRVGIDVGADDCVTNSDFAMPALLVSGDTSAEAERDARDAGFTLLPKPVDPPVLAAVATALVARAMSRAA